MKNRSWSRLLAVVPMLSLIALACDSHGDHDESPTITQIAWVHAAGCVEGTAGEVTVTVSAVDPHTKVSDLVFNGAITGCTGTLNAATDSVTCPNEEPVIGEVTVANRTADTHTATFTVEPCVDGSHTPPPKPEPED